MPYSLLALKKIWTDTCFNVSCHSHSDITAAKSTDEITSFEKILQSDKQALPNKHTVNLTLIWKNGKISSFIPLNKFIVQIN